MACNSTPLLLFPEGSRICPIASRSPLFPRTRKEQNSRSSGGTIGGLVFHRGPWVCACVALVRHDWLNKQISSCYHQGSGQGEEALWTSLPPLPSGSSSDRASVFIKENPVWLTATETLVSFTINEDRWVALRGREGGTKSRSFNKYKWKTARATAFWEKANADVYRSGHSSFFHQCRIVLHYCSFSLSLSLIPYYYGPQFC